MLVAPAQALAAKAEVVDGELRLTAGQGEVNQAGIEVNAAGEFAFYDNIAPLTVGAGCRLENRDPVPDGAICSPDGVTRITVALGDRRDDFGVNSRVPALAYSGGSGTDAIDYVGDPSLGPATITLDDVPNDGRDGRDNIANDVESLGGSFVNDTLTGGLKPVVIDGRDGDDLLTGGAGGDEITAAYVSESGLDLGELYEQGRDTIACGGGNDQVFADDSDQIATDCEVVGLPGKSGRYVYTGSRRADRIVVRQYVDALVKARGGNDVVRLRGGGNGSLYGETGNDDLRGARGSDRFSGGAGRDRIDARDRSRDAVSCGRGRDRVIADKRDRVARDCERVSRG
jgi:Ca2+-binding RTX toxin-like protein